MKENKKSKEEKRPVKNAVTKPVLSAKTIVKESGEIQSQYPAKVGYHGTDNEKDLNPEE